jgi:hypothetical protein
LLVRQPDSNSVPSPHRLFKNSSTGGPVRQLYSYSVSIAPIDCLKIPAYMKIKMYEYSMYVRWLFVQIFANVSLTYLSTCELLAINSKVTGI